MTRITISDLCDHADRVVERVQGGEHLVVTRDGQAVAELRAVPRQPLDAATLLARWRPLAPAGARCLTSMRGNRARTSTGGRTGRRDEPVDVP